jgi:hypothetical protein
MFSRTIVRKRELRSGFYRRAVEERDRIQIVRRDGLVCGAMHRRHNARRETGEL